MKRADLQRGVFVAALAAAVCLAVAGHSRADLVAYWDFEEGTGTTATDSVSGNVGTLANGAAFSTNAPALGGSHSLELKSANNVVTVPDSASLSPTGSITLWAWVNVASVATTGNILAKESNSAYRWRYNSGSGELWALLNDGADSPPHETFYSGVGVPTGVWHHTALTADFGDSKVRFYLDGALVSTKDMTQTASIQDTGGPLTIGAYSGSGGEAFNGNLDEVAIFNHALTDAEIGQLAAGPSGPMVLNPSFEQDTFTTYPGYIGGAGNGPISGWTASQPGHAGINPISGGSSPFADNGTIPDGSQVAFIQRDANTSSLSQTVIGFRPGQSYIVTYRENSRGATSAPDVSVSLGGQTVVGQHAATPVGGSNPYHYVGSAVFNTSSAANELMFTNHNTTADATVLLDDVGIHRVFLHFSDNFSVQSQSQTINPSANDQPGRRGGFLGGLPYVENGPLPQQTQVDHPSDPGALFIASNLSHPYVSVSPDHSFTNSVGPDGEHYVIEYRVNPANHFTGTGTLNDNWWSSVVFGSTSPTSYVNTSDGVGFLIRRNGRYRIFDRTAEEADGDLAGEFGIATGGYYDVRINYFVPGFDGASPASVAIFVDDILIRSFQTDSGLSGNFITLAGYGNPSNGYVYHHFDDFNIYATTIPEPGTVVLFSLGGVGLVGCGWRRRKRRERS